MFTALTNALFNRDRYHSHPEAVVVSCFFNPQQSPYRLLAFQRWYHSIKHLHHRIIECTVGNAPRQLPDTPSMVHVQTESLLWNKEALLNTVITQLPLQFQYVFWVDADVLFTNQRWLTEGVDALRTSTVIQPFEYCVHLERGETTPQFDVEAAKDTVLCVERRHPRLWRSFGATYVESPELTHGAQYDLHGHVGFAWGARREVLRATGTPLYDRALMGGADHIIAHAAANQWDHPCLTLAFQETLEDVRVWARNFAYAAQGRLGYVQGDLYHLWHGDLAKRQYLQRIRSWKPRERRLQRDTHGLWVDLDGYDYMLDYYLSREVWDLAGEVWDDALFQHEMGYSLAAGLSRTMEEEALYAPPVTWTEAPPVTDEAFTGPVEPETFVPLAEDGAPEAVLTTMEPFS